MNELEMQKMFYSPVCNDEEIEKIFNVKSANDYLLKLRADAIVDNTRLWRVMRNRYEKNELNWNFTQHFSTKEFNNYLNLLSKKSKKKCRKISKGFIFSNEPNGHIMRTDFGDIITISESLRYFLFFMNLYFIGEYDIPIDVRNSALRIAIRTMLKSEAMDFELDPRGKIPDYIKYRINQVVETQLEFIIGHEYAHHLLRHLDSNNLIEMPLFKPFKNENIEKSYVFYNPRERQEFEADIAALLNPNYSNSKLVEMSYNAMLFFSFLDIFKCVEDCIFPSISNIKTHPNPIDRLKNIYKQIKKRVKIDKKQVNDYIENANFIKKKLINDVGYNFEQYEVYGSVYLGQWRGPRLIDRVDY